MAETCKSPEQLRQELEAAKVAAMEAEIDRLRSEQQKIAENDTTVISIAPISIPERPEHRRTHRALFQQARDPAGRRTRAGAGD